MIQKVKEMGPTNVELPPRTVYKYTGNDTSSALQNEFRELVLETCMAYPEAMNNVHETTRIFSHNDIGAESLANLERFVERLNQRECDAVSGMVY